MAASLFSDSLEVARRSSFHRVMGRVSAVTGLTVVADGFPLPIGSMCRIDRRHDFPVYAQVVGSRNNQAVLMTLKEPMGVGVGDRVISTAGMHYVPVGRRMLGCVLDGLGRPVGEKADFPVEAHYPAYREAPAPLSRHPVDQQLVTGIRAIDAMHSVGTGQRMGIFAGTGVGKSVLMGMIARFTTADVIVVALVGERGREVGDFIRKDLGEAGMERCVMVVSTSNESPVLRVRAGFTATAVAEYFRDQGNHVLLLLDSTTRLAMAQREIGLSAGEPPTTKGYPPSVFAMLPKLMERSGNTSEGSITGLYTVLVEGDDISEPISDAVRGILDGHLWLSRALANRAHYPAISVLESISRVMDDIVSEEHQRVVASVRRVLATWADIEDLVNVGAYAPGANVEFDVAVQMKPVIDAYLQQVSAVGSSWKETHDGLMELGRAIEETKDKLESRN